MSDFTANMHRIRFLSGLRGGREGKGKGKEREMGGRKVSGGREGRNHDKCEA